MTQPIVDPANPGAPVNKPADAPAQPAAPTNTQTVPAEIQNRINPLLDRGVPAVETPKPAAIPEKSTPAAQADAPLTIGNSIRELVGTYGDDPQISIALTYLDKVATKQGFDLKRAIGNAIEADDPKFLDKAYLKEALGDQAEDFATLFEQVHKHVHVQYAAQIKAVHDLAGGKDNWTQAADVFNAKASPAQKKAMTALLESSDQDTVKYAAEQIVAFAKSLGAGPATSIPQGAPSSLQGISRADYAKALNARNLTDADYERLKQQRRIGMNQGI